MTTLKRKTVKTDPTVAKKLENLLTDTALNTAKKTLATQIDELGLCEAILAPFADTIKKQALLKDKVKDTMVKLGIVHAKGKVFESDRTVTQARVLDTVAVEKALGDLEPYKRWADRNSIKTRKIADGHN